MRQTGAQLCPLLPRACRQASNDKARAYVLRLLLGTRVAFQPRRCSLNNAVHLLPYTGVLLSIRLLLSCLAWLLWQRGWALDPRQVGQHTALHFCSKKPIMPSWLCSEGRWSTALHAEHACPHSLSHWGAAIFRISGVPLPRQGVKKNPIGTVTAHPGKPINQCSLAQHAWRCSHRSSAYYMYRAASVDCEHPTK